MDTVSDTWTPFPDRLTLCVHVSEQYNISVAPVGSSGHQKAKDRSVLVVLSQSHTCWRNPFSAIRGRSKRTGHTKFLQLSHASEPGAIISSYKPGGSSSAEVFAPRNHDRGRAIRRQIPVPSLIRRIGRQGTTALGTGQRKNHGTVNVERCAGTGGQPV